MDFYIFVFVEVVQYIIYKEKNMLSSYCVLITSSLHVEQSLKTIIFGP